MKPGRKPRPTVNAHTSGPAGKPAIRSDAASGKGQARAVQQFLARWKPLLGDFALDSPMLEKTPKKDTPPDDSATPVNPDPFIEPTILSIAEEIAGLLKSRTLIDVGLTDEEAKRIVTGLTVDVMAKSITGTGWALRPFIESPSLAKLCEILRSHPQLYAHPLVQSEIRYLCRLRSDEKEWERLGWQWQSQGDGEYEVITPPEEVAVVDQQLANLIEAHASSLFPQKRIQWKPARKQAGPKGGLTNPHPTWEPWSHSVSAVWLHENF